MLRFEMQTCSANHNTESPPPAFHGAVTRKPQTRSRLLGLFAAAFFALLAHEAHAHDKDQETQQQHASREARTSAFADMDASCAALESIDAESLPSDCAYHWSAASHTASNDGSRTSEILQGNRKPERTCTRFHCGRLRNVDLECPPEQLRIIHVVNRLLRIVGLDVLNEPVPSVFP